MRGYRSIPTQAHNRPNQQIKLYGHHRPRTIKATQPKEDNMNSEELNALEAVTTHIMQNERISYEEHLEEHGTGEEHIYAHAETLHNYLLGLYSTGNIK
jgi:hypothetical protein